MGYISDDGYVVIKNDNTSIQKRQEQVPGYEQFVVAKRVKLVESLPPMTDYRRQYTFVVPIMVNNGHPSGGVYSDLTGDERYNAYKIFTRDPSVSVRWEAKNGWAMYDFEKPTFIQNYTLTTPFYGDVNALPRSWKVYGSKDNRNWVELDSRYYQTLEIATRYNYECQAPHSFRYIKFIFSETRGNVGYALLANIDYMGVKYLSFDRYFDATMPVLMYHTDYSTKITNFASVFKYKDHYKDPDPFDDDSCICYLPFDGNLDELTGKLSFYNYNFTPHYIDKGYKDRTALNFSSYSTNYYIRSHDKIQIDGLDAITICAWLRQDWYNYSEWQSIWHLTADAGCNNNNNCRISALWFTDDDSTDLHYSVYADNKTMSSHSGRYSFKRYKWNFVVAVQGKSYFRLYINGKLVNGQQTYRTTNLLKDSYVFIGDPWHYKAYQIMDFRIFNRELSLDEMFALEAGGDTVARLRDNRLPTAFTIMDSSHKINGRELPLEIEDVDFIRRRKKYRFIDHRLFNGNSVNNYAHITEIQAEDENGVNNALGKPVKVYYSGNGNASLITDGDTDTANGYYSSNTSSSYTRIDLGEPKDIRYIKLWHYYNDYRYYKDIQVMLTNSPSNFYDRLVEDGYVFDTNVRGVYTETPTGYITSNLNYEYEFKVTLTSQYLQYPAEFFLDFRLNYARRGSRFYSLFMENWRNLWFLKPRLFAIHNEVMSITDGGHPVYPRVRVISEGGEASEFTKIGSTPISLSPETSEVSEQVVEVITVGNVKSVAETSKLFEFNSYNITSTVNGDVKVKSIVSEAFVIETAHYFITQPLDCSNTTVFSSPLEHITIEEKVVYTIQ